jgi:rhamnosyl/mannosyltransferase
MKVLQLTKHYPPYYGGVESVTFDLVQGLNKLGVRCDVICANNKLQTKLDKFSTHYIHRAASFGKLFSTSISPALIKTLKASCENYDIIHVHCPDPLTTFALFLIRPKAKIVVHWHSDIIKQKQLLKLFMPLQNWLLSRADKIIGTSNDYIQYSPQLKNFTHKIECIPIGISTERMKVSLHEVEKIKEFYANRKIVFSLGRLIYYKGFEYLIEAVKYLPKDVIVLIGGTGVLGARLQQLILSFELSDRVKLIGRIEDKDLGNYFEASEVFCLPSIERSEAFGVVLLEAMQMGKPIIATKIDGSGVPWVNQDNLTGFNVPIKDPKALAERIMLLLTDAVLYKKIAESSKKRFYSEFTETKMVEKVLKVYTDLLSNNI